MLRILQRVTKGVWIDNQIFAIAKLAHSSRNVGELYIYQQRAVIHIITSTIKKN